MRCQLCGHEFERAKTTGDGWEDPIQSFSPCCFGPYWETLTEYWDSFADEYADNVAFDVSEVEIKAAIADAYRAGAEGLDPYKEFTPNWGKRP